MSHPDSAAETGPTDPLGPDLRLGRGERRAPVVLAAFATLVAVASVVVYSQSPSTATTGAAATTATHAGHGASGASGTSGTASGLAAQLAADPAAAPAIPAVARDQRSRSASTSTSATAASSTGARSPRELLRKLNERIVARDVEGVIALQEANAAIIDYDLSVIRGRDNIRAFYVEWFKTNPTLTVEPQQVFASGGQRQADGTLLHRTASVMGTYSLTQDDGSGGTVTFTGNFCDIVRQQADGSWLYLQDNPYPPHGSSAGSGARVHH